MRAWQKSILEYLRENTKMGSANWPAANEASWKLPRDNHRFFLSQKTLRRKDYLYNSHPIGSDFLSQVIQLRMNTDGHGCHPSPTISCVYPRSSAAFQFNLARGYASLGLFSAFARDFPPPLNSWL